MYLMIMNLVWIMIKTGGQCENLIPTKEGLPFCIVFGVELNVLYQEVVIPIPVKTEKCRIAYAKAKSKR